MLDLSKRFIFICPMFVIFSVIIFACIEIPSPDDIYCLEDTDCWSGYICRNKIYKWERISGLFGKCSSPQDTKHPSNLDAATPDTTNPDITGSDAIIVDVTTPDTATPDDQIECQNDKDCKLLHTCCGGVCCRLGCCENDKCKNKLICPN
jgi:hypothetical protein